jgi:AraC-like DNA-binding protein
MGIHFRYELFPGVDAFAGVRGRFIINDPEDVLAAKVRAVFADPDPVRRYAAAESVALEAMRPFWPERPALDLLRLVPYADALRTVADTLDAQTGVRDLAKRMGFRGTQFARMFSSLLGMTPHQWLDQALLDRALAMLSDPGRTIKDVANELAFSNEFNFSRFIKRLTGLSPSRLRQ